MSPIYYRNVRQSDLMDDFAVDVQEVEGVEYVLLGDPQPVVLEDGLIKVGDGDPIPYSMFLRGYSPCSPDGDILAPPVSETPPLFNALDGAVQRKLDHHVTFLMSIATLHEVQVEHGMEGFMSERDHNSCQVLMAANSQALNDAMYGAEEYEGRISPEEARRKLSDMCQDGMPLGDDMDDDDYGPSALAVSSMGEMMGRQSAGFRMLESLLGRYCPLDVDAISGMSTGRSQTPEESGVAALYQSVVDDPNTQQMPFAPLGTYTAEVHKVTRDGVELLAVKDFASQTVYAWPAAPEMKPDDPQAGNDDDFVPTL